LQLIFLLDYPLLAGVAAQPAVNLILGLPPYFVFVRMLIDTVCSRKKKHKIKQSMNSSQLITFEKLGLNPLGFLAYNMACVHIRGHPSFSAYPFKVKQSSHR
jgi:hypothetical protein